MKKTKLRAGDWVEVRSKEEILATLDPRGELGAMPFMPEMFQFCGQRFQVWKRAHKTCDTVNKTGGRWVENSVHLKELRCDGSAHGGCQAGCLLFWRAEWLKESSDPGGNGAPASAAPSTRTSSAPICREEDLHTATLASGPQEPTDPTYACQATLLPNYTTLLPWWNLRQYWEDLRSGNVGLKRMAFSFLFSVYYRITQRSPGLNRFMTRLYDRMQGLWGGVPFPRKWGTVPSGQPTPTCALNLQPGEIVRVKTHPEILATLDERNRNRGLYYDAEEVPFCGATFRVKQRVSQIINENTGKMMKLKNESVILDGAYCQSRYSDRRLFCPRAVYPMWREIWLERVAEQEKAIREADLAGTR